MELRVLNKPIDVTIGKDDNKFGVRLRQPRYSELLGIQELGGLDGMAKFFNTFFIEFINKPTIKDEDGKEIEYKDFLEFTELTIETTEQVMLFNKVYAVFTKVFEARNGLIKK